MCDIYPAEDLIKFLDNEIIACGPWQFRRTSMLRTIEHYVRFVEDYRLTMFKQSCSRAASVNSNPATDRDIISFNALKEIRRYRDRLTMLLYKADKALQAIQKDCEGDEYSIYNYGEVQEFYEFIRFHEKESWTWPKHIKEGKDEK